MGCATASTQLAVGDGDHPQKDTNGVEAAFNADCLASQTNTSNGVPWMSGSMVWTLFDVRCASCHANFPLLREADLSLSRSTTASRASAAGRT